MFGKPKKIENHLPQEVVVRPMWKIVPVISGYAIRRYSGDDESPWTDSEGYSQWGNEEVYATIEDAEHTIEHLSQPPIYRS